MNAEPLQGCFYIGSRATRGSGETFHAINPATAEKLPGFFYAASSVDAAAAAELAGRAFIAYRKTTGRERCAFLRAIAGQIESISEAIVARTGLETALPEARCRGELARTTGQLRLFAALVEEGSWAGARIDHGDPERKPVPKPDTRLMLQAIGPVAVFGPANFPLAFGVAGGDVASALAAGCPVVVKAHSSHPGVSELCARAVLAAASACGMPDGVFSMLHGSGQEVGPPVVTHPAIKAVGFTGSEKAGRSLFDLAARRPDPIPVFAEMGSLNPVFILPRALRERGEQIAAGLHGSFTLGGGQFCTKPGLLVVEGGDSAQFLVGRLSGLVSQTEPSVLLNRGTLQSYQRGVDRLQGTDGVRATRGLAGSETRAAAALLECSVEAFIKNDALREEVFGPATIVLSAGSREEILEFARSLSGHLTSTVHGTHEDLEEYCELIAVLETRTGRIVFNGYPTGVEVCSSMNHSGPYPASTDSRFTSVGTAAILRFVRPMCYQNCPESALPPELREENPLGIWRLVDNVWSSPA
jgi:NADP-dependent aldehyde dehydrogenase